MRRPSLDRLALALGVYAGAVTLVAVGAATGRGLLADSSLAAGGVSLLVVFGVATTPDAIESTLREQLG